MIEGTRPLSVNAAIYFLDSLRLPLTVTDGVLTLLVNNIDCCHTPLGTGTPFAPLTSSRCFLSFLPVIFYTLTTTHLQQINFEN